MNAPSSSSAHAARLPKNARRGSRPSREAGETGESGETERADRHRHRRHAHPWPQPAHLAEILLPVQPMMTEPAPRKSSALKKRGHQVEDAGRVGAEPRAANM